MGYDDSAFWGMVHAKKRVGNLELENKRLREENEKLKAENEELKKRISELEHNT